MTHAVAAFEELPGVMFAETAPADMDDSPDLAAAPAGTDAYAVVVRGAYNQRTFHTTSRRYRFSRVLGDRVTQVSAQEASRSPQFRSAIADRPWRRKLRWPIKLASAESP